MLIIDHADDIDAQRLLQQLIPIWNINISIPLILALDTDYSIAQGSVQEFLSGGQTNVLRVCVILEYIKW